MTTPLQAYLDRAAECHREAGQATLPQVREQCLRSAFAWENMAYRARLADKYRAEDATRREQQGSRSF